MVCLDLKRFQSSTVTVFSCFTLCCSAKYCTLQQSRGAALAHHHTRQYTSQSQAKKEQEEKAAKEKAAADKKAAEEKAAAEKKAAEDRAAAEKKAADDKAAAVSKQVCMPFPRHSLAAADTSPSFTRLGYRDRFPLLVG